MPDNSPLPTPTHPAKNNDPAHVSNAENVQEKIAENKKLNTSGLSWDETEAKAGETFNRVTEMGEAD